MPDQRRRNIENLSKLGTFTSLTFILMINLFGAPALT